MQICTLASSSSGNCALVSHGSTHLLIDAGISLRRITASLKHFDLSPGDLTGVLITHEHSDHIGGVKMLVKYHRTPVYAPSCVAGALRGIIPDIESCLSDFQAGMDIVLGELSIKSFLTPHDTPESVGYRIEAGRSSLVFVTDLGRVTQTVLDAASGTDLAVIEANHDIDMLKNGMYPPYLKRRVLSDHGHLSNKDSGKLALTLASRGTKKIILAHLSKENNTPCLAFDTVGSALQGKGAVIGVDVELDTAPADGMGKRYIL